MAQTNIFEDLLLPDVPHSTFDLSYNNKLTFNIGQIVPILCKECLPGDRWEINTKPFIRTMPLLAPVLDTAKVDIRYFFVPNRLIWNDWEDFVTGGKRGISKPVQPHFTLRDIKTSSSYDLVSNWTYARLLVPGTTADYLGYPTFKFDPSFVEGLPTDDQQNRKVNYNYESFISANPDLRFNSLPLRAYCQIWNDYFQDRNFITNAEECVFSKASGNEKNLTNLVAFAQCFSRPVASLKDYFTSALPFAQRGQQVTVPVLEGARVVSLDSDDVGYVAGVPVSVNTRQYLGSGQVLFEQGDGNIQSGLIGKVEKGYQISVNELRELSALQRYYETNARGGSRYVEQLLARWNVVSPDSRMQRAEYLGGSRAPLMISEVMQTAPFEGNSGDQALGTLAGKAMSSDSCYVEHYCYEHGWIIGLMYIRPEQTYYQGIHKQLTREVATDYYLPEFANLGEQEIKRNELYAYGNANADVQRPSGVAGSGYDTFGYTPRYSEYKWFGNELHGDMKESLKFWTFARELNKDNSKLNTTFIRPSSTEYSDIFATQDSSHKLIAQVNHHIQCRRSMPMFPVPELK